MSSRFTLPIASVVVVTLLVGGPALARRGKRATKPKPAPAPVVQQGVPPAPPPAPTVDASLPAAEHLAKAKALYDALEYDRVIPFAEAVLANPKATIDERLDAYLLHGSSLAIVGNPIDAEKPFRFLLRGRPNFDLSPDTPPKILSVFRKVQVEERAIIQQMEELERRRVLADMKITGASIEEATGGLPIEFDYVVRDPRGAVGSVNILYRRQGAPNYSSLALTLDEAGRWRGSIPGEWTESDAGFLLEYYVSTSDAKRQTLLETGSIDQPLTIQVAPGTVADAAPFYQTVWFWSLTGVAAATVAASGGALAWFASQPPQSDLGTVVIP